MKMATDNSDSSSSSMVAGVVIIITASTCVDKTFAYLQVEK